MMKWFASCAFATLLLSASTPAADVALIQESKQLGVVITGLQLPASLSKDLTSGLTNRIFVRVTLLANSQSLAQQSVNIAIKYDLWEEVFELKLRRNDVEIATNNFANAQQVIAYLEHLKLTNLFATHTLTANQEAIVKVEVLVNPIDRERMDKVRKWVADNSTYLPSNSTRTGVGDSLTSSRPNELFNKIFEQYSAGADMAAAWKESVTSKPFKLDNLGDAR